MFIMNTNCKLVNIVWIERGIILMIIYFIIQNYKELKNKNIIIENKKVRDFIKSIFYKLTIPNKTSSSSKNFYFNIRKIVKQQDFIIDYINNYDKDIPTDRLWLVPYYDRNDPLIIYKYSKTKKISTKEYKNKISLFSNCQRGNYMNTNTYWDILYESTIINKSKNIISSDIYNLLNTYLTSSYTDTVEVKYRNVFQPVYQYIPQYKDREVVKEVVKEKEVVNHIEVKNNEDMKELIGLIDEKIKNVNEITENIISQK